MRLPPFLRTYFASDFFFINDFISFISLITDERLRAAFRPLFVDYVARNLSVTFLATFLLGTLMQLCHVRVCLTGFHRPRPRPREANNESKQRMGSFQSLCVHSQHCLTQFHNVVASPGFPTNKTVPLLSKDLLFITSALLTLLFFSFLFIKPL